MEAAIVSKRPRESGSADFERDSEERTAVAGVLTEMAARGHQGQFPDSQRQAAFDQSNIFTIFGSTNQKKIRTNKTSEFDAVVLNVVRQCWGKC